jgi:hypothetical protein
MALIPLKIPAGVYRVGTDYEGSGRWRDANLVRWTGGSLRPVGGWSERKDASASVTAAPRGMHTWITNTLSSEIAVGTANEVIRVSSGGTVADITPSGFVAGNEDAQINTAFGGGYFGGNSNGSLYGKKQPSTGVFQEADSWTLDNWGEYLVGCATSDGKLYEWQLDPAQDFVQIANSPEDCKGLIVTAERFIFALQAGGNPRKIAWCDREDNTTWAAAATNEAGDLELTTSGEIMQAVRVRGATLVVTTTDAHLATYQGAPYVYGFQAVGQSCGTASRNGVVSVDAGAFWMGREAFYAFDGSVARQMPCDVQDYVFDDMNKNQITKTYGIHNSEYGEVWWFYPSSGSLECDSYVVYDYQENHWHFGRINRTCGVDQGVFDEPMWIDEEGVIHNHELHGVGHGSYTPFAESAPISLGNGDTVMKVNQLIGDEESIGEVQVQFKTRFHPNDAERVYPSSSTYYDLTNMPTSVRFTGRQVRIRVEATGNQDFRVGTMRVNAEVGGRR